MITPPVATYCWLQYKKAIVKKAVKANLLSGEKEKELVWLKFSKEEVHTKLRWEHDHEFEYQGQMYDLVEVHQQTDSVSYLCWWDHAESGLNQKLESLISHFMGKDPENSSQQERLFEFYKSLFCLKATSGQIIKVLPVKAVDFYAFYYLPPTLAPQVPPPRSA